MTLGQALGGCTSGEPSLAHANLQQWLDFFCSSAVTEASLGLSGITKGTTDRRHQERGGESIALDVCAIADASTSCAEGHQLPGEVEQLWGDLFRQASSRRCR